MREIDPLVLEYQHEKHRPRESEALYTLRKVASLVKPIMRQRSWKVGTLAEFSPSNPNLLGLNINSGQKICLRLRYPGDERQFLPLEQVVDTMLHELCHIVHGPHNREFHALWNQLRKEHEELIMKGYTGELFLSEGRRLGGTKVPIEEVRRQARAAAERRRALSAGSGRKLGGAPTPRGVVIRKVIADAAQRRIDVTKGCGSGTAEGEKFAEEASRNGFRTKAEEDEANERAVIEAYIELLQQEEREQYGPSYIPPSQENLAGPRTLPSPPQEQPPKTTVSPPRSLSENQVPRESAITKDSSEEDKVWACPICTLENPPNFLCCDACGSERPAPSLTANSRLLVEQESSKKRNPPKRSRMGSELTAAADRTLKLRRSAVESITALEQSVQKKPLGWVCHVCGAFMESEWWSCSACGTIKTTS
ncbi:hypothetical protein VTN31DRAFT_3406 [Thermomyces dupontii]|uniref:uncharacterized protein n=1 Tax=Talaromyces thermophilus TaxID=28565 RepID=UPI0037423B57